MDQQLADINSKLDSLKTFIEEKLVTKQELEDLRIELPNRADFAQLQTSVDGISGRFKDTEQEVKLTAARTSRMEE